MKRLPRYCLRIDRNGRGARATRVSLTPGQWRARVRLNGGLMRRWILMAGIAGASVAFSASAFAQAAAESVLTHGLSSAAGTSAGTALGRATNQAAGQLGGRLGQQTPTAAPRQVITTIRPGVQKQTKVLHAATTAQPANGGSVNSGSVNGGSMIASIQGAAPQKTQAACGSVVQPTTTQNADAKTTQVVSAQKQTNCAAKESGIQDANAYQSVITLPAAK